MKPELAALVELPYSSVLKRGRVVHGTVDDIRDSQVILTDGQRLAYEYVIIGEFQMPRAVPPHPHPSPSACCRAASGSSMRAPGKLPDGGAASSEYFRARNAEVVAAKHITIIGGGSIGLELAGEIRAGALVWCDVRCGSQ